MKIKGLIITLLIIFILGASIYLLWQRQPKTSQIQDTQKSQEQVKNNNQKQESTAGKFEPADGFVTDQDSILLKGSAENTSYIVILTSSSNYLVKVKENKTFEKEITLAEGINLVKLVPVKSDFSLDTENELTYYKSKSKNKNTVLAGSVKSIFSNLTTISTSHGEKKIITKNSTEIILPSPLVNQKAEEENTRIRVGDYLIAIGNITKDDELEANQIEIRRDNKPQITDSVIVAEILSGVRQNLFSIKNIKDNKIAEYSIDRNSEIFVNLSKTDQKSIEKNKKAIIVFNSEANKNFVLQVYILP